MGDLNVLKMKSNTDFHHWVVCTFCDQAHGSGVSLSALSAPVYARFFRRRTPGVSIDAWHLGVGGQW